MSETGYAWVQMLGGEVKFVEHGDYRTRCLCAGDGDKPPLVLLHGIGGHAETYLKNVLPLSEGLPDRAIYAIDLVGHGFTSKLGEYTLSDYADHVEDFIDRIGHETAHIHGESLGGWIAAWIGINRPELAESIGLNTMAGVDDGLHEKVLSSDQIERKEAESQDMFDRTNEMIEKDFPWDLVHRRCDWLFYEEPPDEIVSIRYNIYERDEVRSHMPRIYQAERTAIDETGFRDINVPTLIIHTEHNPGGPADTMEYVHEELIPESEIHVYEDSAHWPQWEQYDRYNEHTIAFISTTS